MRVFRQGIGDKSTKVLASAADTTRPHFASLDVVAPEPSDRNVVNLKGTQ